MRPAFIEQGGDEFPDKRIHPEITLGAASDAFSLNALPRCQEPGTEDVVVRRGECDLGIFLYAGLVYELHGISEVFIGVGRCVLDQDIRFRNPLTSQVIADGFSLTDHLVTPLSARRNERDAFAGRLLLHGGKFYRAVGSGLKELSERTVLADLAAKYQEFEFLQDLLCLFHKGNYTKILQTLNKHIIFPCIIIKWF